MNGATQGGRAFIAGQGSRVALVGLTAMLLVLAGCGLSLGGAMQRASADARLHVLRSARYDDARAVVMAEAAWQRAGGPQRLSGSANDPLAQSGPVVTRALRGLLQLGTPTDDPDDGPAPVLRLLAEQRRYRRAVQQFDAALARGDMARAAAIDRGVLAPLLGTIERAVTALAADERTEMLASLQERDHVQDMNRLGGGLLVLGVVLAIVWCLRARAGATLRAREARKSAIMEAALDAIVTMDHTGRILEMNAAAERMFGYVRQAAIGREVADLLVPPALRARHRQGLARHLATGQAGSLLGQRRELSAARADGTEFPIELAITRLPSSEPPLFTAFIRDVTARREAEEALHRSEGLLRTVYNTVACGIVVQDADGAVVSGNAAAERILDLPLDQMQGRTALDPRWQATREDGSAFPGSERPTAAVLHTGREQRGVTLGVTLPGGERRWLRLDAVPVLDETGEPAQVVSSFTDVTEHKRLLETLRETARANEQLAAAVNNLTTSVLITDARQPDQPIVFVNPAFTALTGYRADEALGRNPRFLHGPETDAATLREVRAAVAEARPFRGVVRDYRKDGTPFWNECIITPVYAEGRLTHFIGLQTDVSDRLRLEAELRHQALHDALTDLPNRALLWTRLDEGVAAARRGGTPLALLLLDLDRFKEVNDAFGHACGDSLLQEVAERLRGAVGGNGLVARLGGDEFALLVPAADRADAAGQAKVLCHALDAPFVVDGRRVQIGGSIGIVLCPEHGLDAQTLLRHADVAMYAAKRAGACYAAYAPEQDEPTPDRLALVADLRQAIAGDELRLHYQPQVDLATGRVCGVEALARWPHPARGLIPPDQFIPLAEQAGLIDPLTHWVLETALREHAARQGPGGPGGDLDLSVNLSATNLYDPRLPDTLDHLLRRYAIPARRLHIEVTESTLMADTARAEEVLARLADLGVGVSIDDFGTGYSSLAYLKRLPVDDLKIDKSFVREMGEDAADATIVASIIGLAHNLGVRVVAEGVEDRETWEALARLGCDVVQGYYLSRPLPAAELTQWLRETPYAAAA